jgi:hypothetical protein
MKRSWTTFILAAFALAVAWLGQGHAEDPFGKTVDGLQASVASADNVYHAHEEVELTLTLTNVSDQPIEIDPWPGNWFVQVSDEEYNLMPHVRAVDVIRQMPKTVILNPGEKWDTFIHGLSLTSGIAGSTPDWEYEPLKPGTYRVGAKYAAHQVADRPNMWANVVNSELIRIKIKVANVTQR